MRIGELARRAGVSERSLRYYEQQGLLAPGRRPSGYRDYDEDAVDTVRRIRILLAAGLGTATIAEILPCMVETGDVLAPVCAEMLPDLYRERERLTRAIEEVSAARAGLDRILAAPVPAAEPTDITAGIPADVCATA